MERVTGVEPALGCAVRLIAENISGRSCRPPGKPTIAVLRLHGNPLPAQRSSRWR